MIGELCMFGAEAGTLCMYLQRVVLSGWAGSRQSALYRVLYGERTAPDRARMHRATIEDRMHPRTACRVCCLRGAGGRADMTLTPVWRLPDQGRPGKRDRGCGCSHNGQAYFGA